MPWVLAGLITAIVLVLLLVPGRSPASHALFLRRTGLTLTCAYTALFGAFVMGEAFADPGGWQAAGLVACWLVPLAGLSVLAWFRPGWAAGVLTALIAGTIAVAIWFAADPAWWRAVENSTGPVRALVLFALALPVALLGWHRPLLGGALLLAAGLVPVLVSAFGPRAGGVSLTAAAVPPVITGLMYLFAEVITRQPATHAGAHRP